MRLFKQRREVWVVFGSWEGSGGSEVAGAKGMTAGIVRERREGL
jgi:hypothetical protein